FAHLFDHDLKPKSAYHALTQVFSAYPADSGPVGGTGGTDGAGAAPGAGGDVGAGGLGAGANTGAGGSGVGVGGGDPGVGGAAAPGGGGGGGGCSVGPKTGLRAFGPFAVGLAFVAAVWARRRVRA